jgi:hypothetical protein
MYTPFSHKVVGEGGRRNPLYERVSSGLRATGSSKARAALFTIDLFLTSPCSLCVSQLTASPEPL